MGPPAVTAYLDHNASSPLRPEARDAMLAAMAEVGNPSSVHAFGRRARAAVEAARRAVAERVGGDPAWVVFTSGGTEANNLALRGAAGPVLVSAVEHDSVREAAGQPEAIPVDGDGIVDLPWLARRLAAAPAPRLVSVMLAGNETGVVQPVAEVVRIAHRAGVPVHCDAAQAVGRIPVDMAALGVDLLTISAHKMGGPQGAGALVVRDGARVASLLRGGRQENGRRAGTENVAAIAGFGAAAAAAVPDDGRIAALRDELEARLQAAVPSARPFGAAAMRLPNTTCIAMPGVAAETQVIALDLAGVAVSAGAACASGKVRTSPVLAAMGIAPEAAGAAIRISLGWNSTAADVERCVAAWVALYARTRGSRAAAAA
ncbi:MAG: cysteine desulfurase [Alphaproteobacteria bacterium]|nr:cysteine desulfurase [Alphaproteobacteria bacterium]